MKQSSWRDYTNKAPACPDFTCPQIDSVIEKLEDLRKDNAVLRDCVDYWKDTSLELHEELLEALEWKKNIKKYIKES